MIYGKDANIWMYSKNVPTYMKESTQILNIQNNSYFELLLPLQVKEHLQS